MTAQQVQSCRTRIHICMLQVADVATTQRALLTTMDALFAAVQPEKHAQVLVPAGAKGAVGVCLDRSSPPRLRMDSYARCSGIRAPLANRGFCAANNVTFESMNHTNRVGSPGVVGDGQQHSEITAPKSLRFGQ